MTNHTPENPYPWDDHERELEVIRALSEANRTNLEVMKEIIVSLKRDLYGNGQPGKLDRIQDRLERHERIIWIGMGVMAAMQFLSGSGIISLKGFIGK